MDGKKSCLSEQELADNLNLSYWTVRQMRLQQGLPHFKCGRRVFYRITSVLNWIDQQEQGTTPSITSPIRAIK